MSQMVPRLPDLIFRRKTPNQELWPAAEWVVRENPGLGIVHLMHRSGVTLTTMNDGTIAIRRGTVPDAQRLAHIIEDCLWNNGYLIIAGGGPDHQVALFRAPQSGQ